MIWELFYSEGLPSERSTLQWAINYCHRDKITKPTDFHSLEDLIVHSYTMRVIAILKAWIQKQKSSLKMHDNQAFRIWLSELSTTQWAETMDWLDLRIEKKAFAPTDIWNNH